MNNNKRLNKEKIVEVAVAVIHYKEKFLLGYRFANQHQGEKYEFVGGKLDANETAKQALIREVAEEIAMDISQAQISQLGTVRHNYTDKVVCLQVFEVTVNEFIYESLKDKEKGSLNQPICWVDKSDLLANKYPLPEANQQILAWLSAKKS